MTPQGSLNLDCIASDPSSSYLYGIASANKNAASKDYSDSFVVLVKSNYSPTSLANITWTVVSSVNGKEFSYNYPTFITVDCTANDKGHFAAFFRAPYRALFKTAIVPMGLRYDPVADAWSPIRGTAHYGWTSERFVHKSFFSGGNLVHLLTDDYITEIRFGLVDYQSNMLQYASRQTFGYDADVFLIRHDLGEFQSGSDFDYTHKGLFPYLVRILNDMIVYHNGTFYMSGADNVSRFNSVYERITEITTNYWTNHGNLVHYYLFAGSRNNLTFFGGVGTYGPNEPKIFTMETQENRTYIEHPLNRIDNNTEFAVHANFQTVGGLIEGQEPFVVGLTSDGLYEFTAFGPSAGSMAGPFKVNISANFNSLRQRVMAKKELLMTYQEDELEEQQKAKEKTIAESLGPFTAVFLVCFLFWWVRRYKRRRSREKKEAESLDHSAVSEKHEVEGVGIIPYQEESASDNTSGRRSNAETGLPQPRARVDPKSPNYTYQDQIHELEFSSHPRPNIITSVREVDA
ncbi:hypothetical protein BGX33_004572 [Mortierella sp. NVP41]|nr:hypothetical protein BGX33_004572 [Mortierella sp. NVP41]